MKKSNQTSHKAFKTLKNKTWKEFSRFVRRKNLNWKGEAECITCRRRYYWNIMHAGHYIHGKLDFDEMNVNAQCAYCNKYRHGELGVYALRLIDLYGREKVDDLARRASQFTRYDRLELKEFYDYYKAENDKLDKSW